MPNDVYVLTMGNNQTISDWKKKSNRATRIRQDKEAVFFCKQNLWGGGGQPGVAPAINEIIELEVSGDREFPDNWTPSRDD